MKRNAEKVATCFFLQGSKDKAIVVLHKTNNPKLDKKLKEEVYFSEDK